MSGFEALLAGRTLCERYLIEALIGRGGMGAVYRATDARLGRAVAVKVISPAGSGAADTGARDVLRGRFVREARAAARLHHPNVVTIHDFGTDPLLGLDFLVMELLRGEDLAVRLSRGWEPSPEEAVAVLRGAARGLAAGHRAGLVHRDVKPGNLFLCEEGEDGGDGGVRVLDFGIAQVAAPDDEGTVTHFTRWGEAPLSPAYAAPEQLRGEGTLGPACDVYGLGAIAYQLLAGRRPFADADVRLIAAGLEPADPPPPLPARPGVPDALAALVMRMLDFDPAARPADAAHFLDALDAALGLPPSHPRAASSTPPTAAGPRTPLPGAGADDEDGGTVLAPRRFCAKCGRKLEDDARFCPGCGLPVPGAPAPTDPAAGAPPAPKRRGRRVVPVVAGVLVLAALGALGTAAGTGALPLTLASPGEPPVPPDSVMGDLPEIVIAFPERVREARWAASPVGRDGFCGNFFDACIRVHCSVSNVGDAPGTARVSALLRGDAEHRATSRVRLDPGEGRILTFEFPEVHADERYDEAVCTARPGGGEDPAPREPERDAAEDSEEGGEFPDTIRL